MQKKYKRVFSINNDLGYRNYTVRDLINLKGKTVEKLGLIGKENAIACEAIVSINKYE